MSNVLSEQEKQQVIALGRLGWSLRRIQQETGVRRETASIYLKAAGIPVQPRGRPRAAKPAISIGPVTTDPVAAKPAISVSPVTTDSVAAKPAISVSPVTTDSGTAKPAIVVTTDSEPTPTPSASSCEPFRMAIELGILAGPGVFGKFTRRWNQGIRQSNAPVIEEWMRGLLGT
jgi:hypothetical protein